MALPGVDIDAVEEQVQRQCDALPRAEAARSALSHSCIVRVGGREEVRITAPPCLPPHSPAGLLWFKQHSHAMHHHLLHPERRLT